MKEADHIVGEITSPKEVDVDGQKVRVGSPFTYRGSEYLAKMIADIPLPYGGSFIVIKADPELAIGCQFKDGEQLIPWYPTDCKDADDVMADGGCPQN